MLSLYGIVAGLVQVFFAWRIKVLTHNYWIVGIILFFTVVQVCRYLHSHSSSRSPVTDTFVQWAR